MVRRCPYLFHGIQPISLEEQVFAAAKDCSEPPGNVSHPGAYPDLQPDVKPSNAFAEFHSRVEVSGDPSHNIE
jgi:hypothetical protein